MFIESRDDFERLVKLGATRESRYLEFKREPSAVGKGKSSDEKQAAQLEICRDIAQFANTLGGCLLIGISEVNGLASGNR